MHLTPGGTAFLPAVTRMEEKGWIIDPLPWRGSGDRLGFSRANALVIFQEERSALARGERAEALFLLSAKELNGRTNTLAFG